MLVCVFEASARSERFLGITLEKSIELNEKTQKGFVTPLTEQSMCSKRVQVNRWFHRDRFKRGSKCDDESVVSPMCSRKAQDDNKFSVGVGTDEELDCVAGQAYQVWEPGGSFPPKVLSNGLERVGDVQHLKRFGADAETHLGIKFCKSDLREQLRLFNDQVLKICSAKTPNHETLNSMVVIVASQGGTWLEETMDCDRLEELSLENDVWNPGGSDSCQAHGLWRVNRDYKMSLSGYLAVGLIKGVSGELLRVVKPFDEGVLSQLLKGLLDKGINCLAVVLMNLYSFLKHDMAVRKLSFRLVPLSVALTPMARTVLPDLTATVNTYLTHVIKEYLLGFISEFKDGYQKVRTMVISSRAVFSKETAPHGVKSFVSVLKLLWKVRKEKDESKRLLTSPTQEKLSETDDVDASCSNNTEIVICNVTSGRTTRELNSTRLKFELAQEALLVCTQATAVIPSLEALILQDIKFSRKSKDEEDGVKGALVVR